MDWEALSIMALIAVAFGVLLYVPATWWARRKLRRAPADSHFRINITSAGLALCTLTIGFLVAGTAQPYLAPQTAFGRFLATAVGFLAYLFAVAVLTVVLGMVLQALGYTLFRRPDGDQK